MRHFSVDSNLQEPRNIRSIYLRELRCIRSNCEPSDQSHEEQNKYIQKRYLSRLGFCNLIIQIMTELEGFWAKGRCWRIRSSLWYELGQSRRGITRTYHLHEGLHAILRRSIKSSLHSRKTVDRPLRLIRPLHSRQHR